MKLKYSIPLLIWKNKFIRTILYQIAQKLKRVNSNNRIVVIKLDGTVIKNPKIKGLKVKFLGKNNYIEIKEPYRITEMDVICRGSNNVVKIGRSSGIRSLRIFLGDNTKFISGENFTVQGAFFIMHYTNNTEIKIGSGCMMSYGVMLRTTDSHTIYDLDSYELLNPSKSIEIGNHVWIAHRALLLKGSKIPDNCTVAAGSIVTKEFNDTNCILAGIPAKVVKRNVNWNKCFPEDWDTKKIYIKDLI